MDTYRLQAQSPTLLMSFGAVLFLIAVVHHTTELATVNQLLGPVIAALLDGTLAVALIYAGYWLSRTDLLPRDRWRVFTWSLFGGAVFVLIMGVSLIIRASEGRVIGEPLFPLLLATEAGGLAGAIAGYQTSRAEASARRAQTVSEALGFVNSLIRHDLRNDLNVIQGHARLLKDQRDTETSTQASNSPVIIDEQTEEALTLIETTNLVVETLSGDAELEAIDLVPITAEIGRRIESTHEVMLETTLPEQAHVIGNKGLRSVVDNLVENAVEHNDADEPKVHIGIDVEESYVQLTVKDNGPGLSDEQKEQVLTPDPEENTDGGLALVRTLVEGYDGTLSIEDNHPRGAVFTVELPRATEVKSGTSI